MPTYITVKVAGNAIFVKFNDLATNDFINAHDGTYKRETFIKIWHHYEPEMLEVTLSTGEKWPLSHDGSNGTFPVSWVDLGDGNGEQAPTDLENLHTLLQSIIEV